MVSNQEQHNVVL